VRRVWAIAVTAADDDGDFAPRIELDLPETRSARLQGKTCIVIAHHLATILGADIIFVVKDLQLGERGTHEQLLAARGLSAV
jgi:ABC-type transport system involved in Fe-S cluster assembly fused permease/ATPase subunit